MATPNPITRVTLDRPAAEALSKQWWMLLLAGIFSAVVGIVILSVNWTLADLALVVSIFFVVNGAFRAATPPVDNTGRGWNLAVGILEIFVVISFLAWPGVSLLTLAIFIGAWVFVRRVFDLAGGISSRHDLPFCWLYMIPAAIHAR